MALTVAPVLPNTSTDRAKNPSGAPGELTASAPADLTTAVVPGRPPAQTPSDFSTPGVVALMSLDVPVAAGQRVARRDSVAPAKVIAAAKSGNLEVLQRYLLGGGDPNATDGTANRRPLLSLCAVRGQTAALELLLSHGADVHRADAFGALPIHKAAQSSSPNAAAAIDALLAKDPATLEAVCPTNGHTPLVEASFGKKAAQAERLLERGANPAAATVRGRPPLDFVDTTPEGQALKTVLERFHAPDKNDPRVVAYTKALLQRDGVRAPPATSPVDAKQRELADQVQAAVTAVCTSAAGPARDQAWGQLEALVEVQKADLNVLGGLLSQPVLGFLGTAPGVPGASAQETDAQQAEVAKYLLAHGADPFTRELHPMALDAGWREVVFGKPKLLAALLDGVPKDKLVAFVNEQGGSNGLTRLHDAVLRATADAPQYVEIVRLLLAAGARVDLENDAGETVFELATRPSSTLPKQLVDLIRAAAR